MMSPDNLLSDLNQSQRQLLEYMKHHGKLFFWEGVLFILLGLTAIIIPQFFSVFIVLFLGWLILFGGIVQVSRVLYLPKIPGFAYWLGLAFLQVLVGYLLIADPIAGVLTFTMMLILFFATEGIIKIYLALAMRPLPHWSYVLASGLMAIVLAVLMLMSWSELPQWIIGIFIGINMIFLGVAMLKISLKHVGLSGDM